MSNVLVYFNNQTGEKEQIPYPDALSHLQQKTTSLDMWLLLDGKAYIDMSVVTEDMLRAAKDVDLINAVRGG